jgi:uncharacterized protein (TIGR00266 family)
MDLFDKVGGFAKSIDTGGVMGKLGDLIEGRNPTAGGGGDAFCGQCGAKNTGGNKFCASCGAPLASGGGARAAFQTQAAVARRKADEVDYKIYGNDLQFVEIELDPGEAVVAEAGAMMYMDRDIQMETIFGDGSSSGGSGLKDTLFAAGRRVLSGAGLFMTAFQNAGSVKHVVAFAAPYPGKIVPMEITEAGGPLICQKDAFLCAAKGIAVSIAFQKKIGVGLFGGEGFIMQKLEGEGRAFIHAGGTIIQRDLTQGEMVKLDTGCLVAMTSTVNYDIQFASNIKTALFGGEGLALATLEGPGSVWLQSLPFSRLADRIHAARKGGQGEGSVLGNIGIGNLLGGNKS